MIFVASGNTFEPFEIIHNDGKLTAFITKELRLDDTAYYNGFIVVDDTHQFYGLDEYQIHSELTSPVQITFTSHLSDDMSKYIFGFDDVYKDLGYTGVKQALQTLVSQCLPLVKDVPQSIANWFHILKPEPTNQNIIQQMAYHFEEVAEMCEAIKLPFEVINILKDTKQHLLMLADNPDQRDVFITGIDKVALLDALADQQVTANGVGTLLGFDMPSALIEVNESNYTKFEDAKAVIDKQGKITKGKHYRKPNLKPYI